MAFSKPSEVVTVVSNMADENSVDVVAVSDSKPARKKKKQSFADEIFQGMGLDQEAQSKLKKECDPLQAKPTALVDDFKNPYLGGKFIQKSPYFK